MQGKKAYIAGKITGDPDYKTKFDHASLSVRVDGYSVMSPAILPDGFDYDDYMHVCYAMVDVCDTVFFLPDWGQSPGAKAEHKYATEKGKAIKYLFFVKPTCKK